MQIHKGFDGIDFTEWVLFKMLIKIYGDDKLISTLKKIKAVGGIKEIHTVG